MARFWKDKPCVERRSEGKVLLTFFSILFGYLEDMQNKPYHLFVVLVSGFNPQA
jgi:hypothetical protein